MIRDSREDSRTYVRHAALAEAVASARRRGMSFDADSFARRYELDPSDVRNQVELLETLDELGSDSRAASAIVDGESSIGALDDRGPATRTLGDFRLLRRIGSGGMGVVYEAEQISLARRVALKVLPNASTLDPRRIERFQREARAAASLDHPHLVPVHAVGLDDGVYYYAMRFVDGETLAARIARLPRSAAHDAEHIREGVRLAGQAAQALAHAHERGVIHRDIKPSNLLFDENDDLRVADFGLAALDEDSGATRTGDVLGSVPYLSPELAAGRRDVDARTDLYSLAATLYEWLTLRPVFDGAERAETIRAILSKEPRSLRRLNPAVPRPLETIVERAMAKRPADRYASMRDLAWDLERFLAGESIVARRPSVGERLARIADRHRTAVAFGVVGLVVAIVVLAVGNTALRRASERADRERDRAQAHARRARDVIDGLLTRVATERLAETPHAMELRREMLEDALRYYEGFVEDAGDDAALAREASLARGRVGKIYEALGRFDEAATAYRESIEEHDRLLLTADADCAAGLRQELARAWNNLGVICLRSSRDAEAVAAYRRSIEIKRDLVASDPGRSEFRVELARSLSNLAMSLGRVGDHAAAAACAREALDVKEHLVAEFPDSGEFRDELAMAYCGVARDAENRGELDVAREEYSRAIEQLETAIDQGYASRSTRASLYGSIGLRGTCAAKTADWPAARRDFDAAVAGLAAIHADHPTVLEHRADLSLFLSNRGLLALQLGDIADARSFVERALAHREAILEARPDAPTRMRDVAESLHHSADILSATWQFDEADARYRRANELRSSAVSAAPDDLRFRQDLAAGHASRAALAERRNDRELARAEWESSVEGFRKLRVAAPANMEIVESFAVALHGVVRVAFAEGRFAAAKTALREALAMREQLAERFPEDPRRRRALADVENDLAWFLVFGAERTRADAEEALVLARRAVDHAPEVPAYKNPIGVAHCRLGDWQAAVGALEQSVEARAGGDANDWAFLALAYANLGRVDDARLWRDRAQEAADAPAQHPPWILEALDACDHVLSGR